MFIAEKGISIPTQEVNLMAAENRKPPYTDRNPGGQLPALDLDNGKCLGETVAIFEYLEENFPTPPLIGTNAEERAETRQWQRRVEMGITENVYNSFRYSEGIELFKTRIMVLPEAAPGLKSLVQDRLSWLDGLMDGNQWVAGNRFTIVDIILYCALDFAASVGRKLPDGAKWLPGWMERVGARPSAAASLHPLAAKAKVRG